jgi:hypothetical protein
MQSADRESHGDPNYELCDQQSLHQLSGFLRD